MLGFLYFFACDDSRQQLLGDGAGLLKRDFAIRPVNR